MNKPALRIIILLAFTLSCNSPVLAVKTNVNEVNDLFDRNIENKDQLMRDLQEQREGAVRDIETGKGLEHVEGIGEAESKARELESIREVNLESSGRQKRASEEYRFYDENELEPDYSKPGNIAHKQDVDEIVSQTGIAMKKLGKDLQTKLSALGIDCQQVKGPIQKDLTYHMEISGEEHKNSEYEQVICEELRNKYQCQNTLTMNCINKRRIIDYWTFKSITIPYRTIPRHWWVVRRLNSAQGRWTINTAYNHEIAARIASITGFKVDEIRMWPHEYYIADLKWRGESEMFSVFYNWNYKTNVRLDYEYRPNAEKCDGWKEEWNEVCRLQ